MGYWSRNASRCVSWSEKKFIGSTEQVGHKKITQRCQLQSRLFKWLGVDGTLEDMYRNMFSRIHLIKDKLHLNDPTLLFNSLLLTMRTSKLSNRDNSKRNIGTPRNHQSTKQNEGSTYTRKIVEIKLFFKLFYKLHTQWTDIDLAIFRIPIWGHHSSFPETFPKCSV